MGGAPTSTGYSPTYYDLDLQARFDDGSTLEFSYRVGGLLKGTDLRFSEGDIVPVRYDPQHREKIEVDETAMRDESAGRADTFAAARVRAAELKLASDVAEKGRSSAPSDAELQDVSDRWDAAREKAAACLAAHGDAKAAGNPGEAKRQLAEGALANAEQVQLGEEFKRLKRLRPDWEPARS
jgi:hypothetical protein